MQLMGPFLPILFFWFYAEIASAAPNGKKSRRTELGWIGRCKKAAGGAASKLRGLASGAANGVKNKFSRKSESGRSGANNALGRGASAIKDAACSLGSGVKAAVQAAPCKIKHAATVVKNGLKKAAKVAAAKTDHGLDCVEKAVVAAHTKAKDATFTKAVGDMGIRVGEKLQRAADAATAKVKAAERKFAARKLVGKAESEKKAASNPGGVARASDMHVDGEPLAFPMDRQLIAAAMNEAPDCAIPGLEAFSHGMRVRFADQFVASIAFQRLRTNSNGVEAQALTVVADALCRVLLKQFVIYGKLFLHSRGRTPRPSEAPNWNLSSEDSERIAAEVAAPSPRDVAALLENAMAATSAVEEAERHRDALRTFTRLRGPS